MSDTAENPPAPSIRTLLILAIPALVIGVGSALLLWLLEKLAGLLEGWVWDTLPGAVGADGDSPWWIFGVLTLTGIAVGLCLWVVPGHGGPDSATTELLAPPLKLAVLPGLALVVVLSLAGGVSLGPENPIIAINVALAVALMTRLIPKVPAQMSMLIAASATIGALFGTPVAAALIFTGVLAAAKMGGSLWDRLFLPLVAAGAGAVTMHMLGGSSLAVKLPAYPGPQAIDLLTGTIVAAVSLLLGLIAVFAFPWVHRFFHGLRYPLLYVTLGGVLLGVLGAIGGPLTLFKGLSQMSTLVNDRADYSAWQLFAFGAIKVVALVIAASAGFRGGRIFPAVFIGVAFGLTANAFFPSIPITLAVACGVLGVVLAIGRDGWLAIFVAVAVAGDITLLPVICIIVLPVWLMVSRAPEMLITTKELAAESPAPKAT